MKLESKTRRGGSAGLAKASFLAGMPCEDTIPVIIVNRLRLRFGVTAPHAATIAQLAELGPREAR